VSDNGIVVTMFVRKAITGVVKGTAEMTLRFRSTPGVSCASLIANRCFAIAGPLFALLIGALAVVLPARAAGGSLPSGGSTETTHFRVLAVAGSPRYLIYTKFALVPGPHHLAARGGLYVINRAGVEQRFGDVRRSAGSFSLSGSMLYFHDSRANSAKPVNLWNLRTGRKRAEASEAAIAAAPDGFIEGVRSSTKPHPIILKVVSVNGAVTRLGDPFPAGQQYVLNVGSTSYVASSARSFQHNGIITGRFATPHHTRVLLQPGSADAVCGDPSSAYVACLVSGTTPAIMRLYSLHGGIKAHAPVCRTGIPTAPAALGKSIIFLGCGRHLVQRAIGRGIETSKRTFLHRAPVQALGEIVLSSHSRTKLFAMSSATAKPKTLVSVS
jgi:hypothetical protein